MDVIEVVYYVVLFSMWIPVIVVGGSASTAAVAAIFALFERRWTSASMLALVAIAMLAAPYLGFLYSQFLIERQISGRAAVVSSWPKLGPLQTWPETLHAQARLSWFDAAMLIHHGRFRTVFVDRVESLNDAPAAFRLSSRKGCKEQLAQRLSIEWRQTHWNVAADKDPAFACIDVIPGLAPDPDADILVLSNGTTSPLRLRDTRHLKASQSLTLELRSKRSSDLVGYWENNVAYKPKAPWRFAFWDYERFSEQTDPDGNTGEVLFVMRNLRGAWPLEVFPPAGARQ